jgi:crotonobetainyl-CoA:carnitine CoA-transferase CaiB-like acyl-CoA transferase
MSTTPLAGLKVIDFTRVLAGPLCTQHLGLMGADVIKIESNDIGDEMRSWPPFKTDQAAGNATGTPFLAVNHNKRSITVNLKAPEGNEIVRKLIKDADVVIESFALGVGARLGISAADVRTANPRAIHCSITGFGSVGPMKDMKGYDVILQAFSGMLAMIGERDGPPARIPFSPIDQATGMNAVIGILAALNERNRSGIGGSVEVSLFDSATSLLCYMLQNYWQRGTDPQRFGVAHESLCPYEAFDTSDRPLILGIANDGLWRAFCNLIGRSDLIEDPRFKTNADRVTNRAETLSLVSATLLTRSCDEWFSLLSGVGIPCSPLHKLSELVAHPHARASGMIYDYDHPLFGRMSAVAQPIKFDGLRTASRRAPPGLGEHNDEVLEGLGYSSAAIAALREAGVIGPGAG